MIRYAKGNAIRPDIGFAVYFPVMFCFYTNTYIQLMAQMGIILYVLIKQIAHGAIAMPRKKEISLYLAWIGLLTLLFYVSKHTWAYGSYAGSKTMMGLFRVFMIGFFMWWYVNSYEKAVAVFESLVIGAFIMGIAVFLTTPPSEYGKTGEEGFGTLIGQHRNQVGGIAAPMIFICYFFGKSKGMKHGKKLAAFFALLLLCSGSRGALIQALIIALLMMITTKQRFSRKLYIAAAWLLILTVGVILIQSIPFLYDTFWTRIQEMLVTMSGEDVADASTLGRELYKVVAWKMFLQSPWLGFGLDGFYCYLRDHPIVNGYYVEAVYSHSNFAELAANLGIAGLAVWYAPVLNIWYKSFKNRAAMREDGFLLCVLTSMIALDYARIPWATHLSMYLYFCVFLMIIQSLGRVHAAPVNAELAEIRL